MCSPSYIRGNTVNTAVVSKHTANTGHAAANSELMVNIYKTNLAYL